MRDNNGIEKFVDGTPTRSTLLLKMDTYNAQGMLYNAFVEGEEPAMLRKYLDAWTTANNRLYAREILEAAPRGSPMGTQGLKGNMNRSVVPKQLCVEILQKLEK